MVFYHSQTQRHVVNEDKEYCYTGSGWDFFAAKLAKAGDVIIKAVWVPRSEISLCQPFHVLCLYICTKLVHLKKY